MFWILLIAAYLFITPIFGLAAFFRGSQASELQLARLTSRVDELKSDFESFRRRDAAAAQDAPADAAAPEPEPETPPVMPAEAPPAPQLQSEEPSSTDEPEEAGDADAAQPPSEPPAGNGGATPPPEKPALSLEQWLTSRGLIWLGGITLALAGLFLAKFSYDHGWLALGPAGRVTLGFLFGVALAAAGEWLRRRPLQAAVAAIGPNYLPPALTAAGLASAFGSVYAAYGLYALLSPFAAFALMALVAFAAFGLAILQGPFIAVLALLGGYATPLLVSTPDPSALALFGYLFFVTAAALAVVRYMACWWLAWGALIGATLWPLLWFQAYWSPQDAAALGSYIVLLAGLFLVLRYRAPAPQAVLSGGEVVLPLTVPDLIGLAGAAATAFLGFVLVRMEGYGALSLIASFLLVCVFLVAAWREPAFEGLVVLGASLALGLLLLWHLPEITDWPNYSHSYQGRDYGTPLGPIVPPQLGSFLAVSFAYAALFGAAGYAALAQARRPALWAGVSAGLPVLLLAVAYWRFTGIGVDLAWSGAAVAIAAATAAAAAQLHRRLPHPGGEAVNALLVGIYALGSLAALSLAMTMVLERAWLTVALSLQLPAIAWISTRLDLKTLRPLAFLLAAVVLVRLVLNYNILDYPLGSFPAFNWILYGYGIPALAFWWSARRFRRQADDMLVLLLEGGTLVLTWLLVTFEIRSLMAGSLTGGAYDFAEQSMQTVAWLAMAYGWLRAYRRSGRAALLWGWRLLAGLAAVHSPLFQLLLDNPLWSGFPVGDWPLINLLGLGYLVPGVFALLFARELRGEGHRKPALAAAVYGLLLVFVYLSLEVRRAFHGPVLSLGPTSDAELLTYSLVWLGYAWVIFGLGLKTGFASLRYAALAVLAVATAKVLFFDWAALEGLGRFFSFTALGCSLLGIPFLYQKLVFPPAPPREPAEASEPST